MSKGTKAGTAKSPVVTYSKVPPQNIEIERMVLGICLMEKEAFELTNEIITHEEVFHSLQHQIIFIAMRSLFVTHRPIDILTVQEWLKETGQLETVGGVYFLTTLTDDVVSSAHLQEHCLILVQKYINRKLIVYCQETIGKAYSEGDCFDNSNDLISSIELVTHKAIAMNSITMEEGLFKFMEQLGHRRNHQDQLTGVPSGFIQLDSCTNGWQPTDLIILAARPSVGKTALAINMAINAASNERPTAVGIFSLEMSKDQLVQRMVSNLTEMDADMIRRGRVDDAQFGRLTDELSRQSKLPIYIDDTPGLNWLELRAKARRMHRLYGIGLFIVDYLQLMSDVSDGEKRNREQQISRITRELKKLAKDLKVPIIALSQLSRETEKRSEKIPQLSDLRESGAIEQDADIVAFIYRPEYYDIHANENGESTKGETWIKIAKHRNGTLDTIKLIAQLNIQKFKEGEGLPSLQKVEQSASKGFSMWQPVERD